MNANLKYIKDIDGCGKGKNCATCLYLERDAEIPLREKCVRFARFVDHMLNESSRDCEYWQGRIN